MARKVKGRQPGSVWTFVPRCFDNHLAPESEKVTVRIKHPSAGQLRDLAFEDSKTRAESILSEVVISVTNYEQPNGVPILTGSDLAKFGESEFVVAVLEAIQSETVMGESEAVPFGKA